MSYRYIFTIKKPRDNHVSFDIVCDKRGVDGRTQTSIKKMKVFADEGKALEAVNNKLKSGATTQQVALVLVEQIVKGLKVRAESLADAKSKIIISDFNLKLFTEYWEDVYSDRKLRDRERTYNTFLYALRTLEPHSLISTDKETMRKVFEKKLSGNAHRRYTIYLNMLLTYFNRGFTLSTDRSMTAEVKFIDIDDFRAVLAKCTDEKLKLLIATLFCTGVRTGEAFALSKNSIKADKAVYITHQIDRKLVRRLIKNDKPHEAIIIADFLKEIKAWCAMPQDEKNELRLTCGHSIPEFFRAHGYDITSHELRHSYVHYLTGKGLTVDDIADCLGDTHEVVKKHYQGWILGDKRISHLYELVNTR